MCLITKYIRINIENLHKCVSEYSIGIEYLLPSEYPSESSICFSSRYNIGIIIGNMGILAVAYLHPGLSGPVPWLIWLVPC